MKMRKSIIFTLALALMLSVPMTSFGATKNIKLTEVDDYVFGVYEDMFLLQNEEGKYGYVDKTGKVMIPFIYDEAFEFVEGLAYVNKDDKYGYIDKTGKVIIPFIYGVASSFENGLACVGKGDDDNIKFGCIDKTGKVVVPFLYEDLIYFNDGLARVGKGNGENIKYGHIDKTGKVVIPFIYEETDNFYDGLAKVVNGEYKTGYIDKTGKVVIPFLYDSGKSFSEGFACVGKIDGDSTKYGYIDKTGKEITPFIYEYISGYFNEGLAGVYKDGGKYIDTTGKVAIPFVYDYCWYFEEGLAVVGKNGKQGCIDKTGKVVLPFIYDEIYTREENLLEIKNNDKYGIIDRQGNEVLPCIYDELNIYEGNIIAIKGEKSFVGNLKESSTGKENTTTQDKEPVSQVKEDKKALSTSAKVLVNGKEIDFEAYNIDGNNYFKLRDLAKVVSGTEKQFEITWDQEKKAVNMISNKGYTVVGGELEKKDVKDEKANLSNSVIYKDGKKVDLKAYLIKGNNYFKLRDVAKAFDIGIGWDNETKTITVDTAKSYE